MNAFDLLFSLAIFILIGIGAVYWHEARRRPPSTGGHSNDPDGNRRGDESREPVDQGRGPRPADPGPTAGG